MIELKLNWFTDDEPADDTPAADPVEVPDTPGVGGILTAWKEVVDSSTILRATYTEVLNALNHGWVVAIFDGAGKCAIVTEASIDDSGDTDVYVIKDSASNEFDASSADVQPTLKSVEENASVPAD